jgi:hypothetical protein
MPGSTTAAAAEQLGSEWQRKMRVFGAQSPSIISTANTSLNFMRLGRPERFADDLLAAREVILKPFLTPERLSARILGGWGEEEKNAFQLGEEIDQGMRPRNAHRQLEDFETSFESTAEPPPYLGSRYYRPGELPPESSWTTNVSWQWVTVLGTTLDLGQLAQDCESCPDDQSKRCALVDALMRRAAETLDSGRDRSPLLGLLAGSSTEGGSTQGNGKTRASNLGRLPLHIDPLKREICIKGTDRVAKFGGNKLAFKLASLVHDRTHRHGIPFVYAELHFELWGTRKDTPDHRDKIRHHVLIANQKMSKTIDFELRAENDIGYVFTDLEDSSVKRRRKRRRK